MIREQIIKHWDVIQAFKEGKTIQYYDEVDKCWFVAYEPSFRLDVKFRINPEPNEIVEYSKDGHLWFTEDKWPTPNCTYYTRIRIIKPEPTKRLPTIEEVEKWFLENKVFLYKNTNTFYRIESFTKHPKQGDKVIYIGEWHTIKNFCEDHAHYNGTELYITE